MFLQTTMSSSPPNLQHHHQQQVWFSATHELPLSQSQSQSRSYSFPTTSGSLSFTRKKLSFQAIVQCYRRPALKNSEASSGVNETGFLNLKADISKGNSTESLTSNYFDVSAQVLPERECLEKYKDRSKRKKRVFFLDVNPLCYAGSKPSLHAFGRWVSLFFSQVSLTDPVIAVFDGEKCNEQRRQLLPSYKAHRRKFVGQSTSSRKFLRSQVGRSQQLIMDVLRKCNVPIIKIEGSEADDVVATLVEQVLQRGYQVVIASPDKDFKQLISENVQLVMPLVELDRWSFYTLKHYIAQYNCDPHSDLSLRCILGDEVDGVPGIQHLVPGFGRKTALKLLKKHGSLENLLNAAAVRTVGRQYAQEALTKYADYLRRNYQVLALRKDVDVHLQEQWLVERDTCNDSSVLSNFFRLLEETEKPTFGSRSYFSNG